MASCQRVSTLPISSAGRTPLGLEEMGLAPSLLWQNLVAVLSSVLRTQYCGDSRNHAVLEI